jgi:hypothetical protein
LPAKAPRRSFTSQLGGIGVHPPIDNSDDAPGLVQATAGLGGGSGAADGLNAAGFDIDVSPQQFLTAPQ